MKKTNYVLLILALLLVTGNFVYAQRIMITVAGTGTGGYSGDYGSGMNAQINGPNDICMDAAQNLYIADQENNRIRMVSAAKGVVTTIGGGGVLTIDGIPAVNAYLEPNYMCIDAAGNLYITEGSRGGSSNKIRKIDAATGIITTIAGTGTAGFYGDGGLAISAELNSPRGICMDASDNLYVVDAGNNRIRKIAAGTGIITTIAGSGASGYSGDGGLALTASLSEAYAIGVNSAGIVYFSDQGGIFIRGINQSTGVIFHVAGTDGGYVAAASGGPASSTAIGEIYGIHVDVAGDVFLCDGSCSCTEIDATSGNIYLEGGSLSYDGYNFDGFNSVTEYLNEPGGLWVDRAGTIYIADYSNNRVRKDILLTHTPTFAYGEGQFINPCDGGVFSLNNNLSITDMDPGQTETWTVVTPPVHGILTGFPVVATSNGTTSITSPTATLYTVMGSYSGLDSFQVKVSDGSLTDLVTIYVSVGAGAIDGPTNICATTPVTLTDYIPYGAWTATNGDATVSSLGLVTGMMPGWDTIVYTVVNACGTQIVEKAINVALAAPATAGTIGGPTSVCVGTTIALTNDVTGGAWTLTNTTNASVTATGITSGITGGTDEVIYTVTNGCGSIATSEDINIISMPDAGTISSAETAVCKGDRIRMEETIGGGIWSVSNGNSSVSNSGYVTGLIPGMNTIVYTMTNSCGTATATREIQTIDCNSTGVATVNTSPGYSVYPNPTSSVLNLEWQDVQPGHTSLNLTNVAGQVVLTNEFMNNGAGSMALSVAGLGDGVYLLTVNSETAHYTYKVIINN